MKKIILWVLLAAVVIGAVIGVAVSVNNTTDPQQTEAPTNATTSLETTSVDDVIAYLKSIYKDDGAKTPIDFERYGIVRIAGVPYEVVWTADIGEEFIKVVVNDDGTVTIDVNEECAADTPYVLTATVTDENGNTASHSWNYILPEAVDMIAIVKAAYALKPGESLPYESTLRGKITTIKTPYDPSYKNITVIIEIAGAEDMPIECYRLKGEGADELQIGDIITVTGTLKNYNGTIEFDAGCILEQVIPGERVKAPSDPKQIVDEAYALGANKSLPYEATLTGTIISVDQPYDEFYGNITVTIEIEGRESKPIKCYRLKGSGVDKIGVNDLITVRGYITNYVGSKGHSTIEFVAGCILEAWEDRETPVAPSDPTAIVDAAYALGANKSLPYVATLTGKITKVTAPYDPNYGNITVTIEIEGRKDKPIVCYRMKGNGVDKIENGDIITVRGYIKNYVGDKGYSTIEFDYPTLVSYQKNTVQAPTDMVQIVKEAYALAGGEQLPYKATLTGTITKVTKAYDPGFKNVTVLMAVEGAEDMPIKCYRLAGDGASKIGVGDIITVTGNIEKYVHSSGDSEVEFVQGCILVKWMHPDGTTEPDEPEDIVIPNQSDALKTGDKVVIFAPAYNKALSANKVDAESFYNKGVDVTVKGGQVSGYGNSEIWTVTKNADGTYSFANGGKNIGMADQFSSLSLGEKHDDWQLIKLGGSLYNMRNVGRGNFVEWYASKDNWSSYNSSYAATDDQFQLSIFVIGKGILTEKVEAPEEPTVPAPKDQVQILKEAYALAVNAELPYKATLTGKITKITEEYSTQYNNVTVIIEVAGAEDMPIKCYRMKGTGADKIAVGDTITVTGNIINYQHSSGDCEVEFKQGCTLDKWTPSGTTQPTEPTEPEVTEPTTPPETSSALNTGDKVVIFAPAYNKALSVEKVAQFYNKGVDITVTNGNVSGYSDAEIWTVTKNSDGTYSFANGGQNIGLADTFSSMSQGAIHDDWQIISLGGSLYNLKNVGRGNFMEWYASKDNWSTYASDRADTDDQFQLSFFVIGKGILEEEVKPTEPTTPTEPEVTEPEVTEPSVAPTEPEVTEPSVKPEDGLVAEPQVGVAYKMGMNKNDGNILFFNGQTESASVTYRLATTTNSAEAIDVYLEAVEGVEGGYRLYFMNGDTKTYIRVFHRTDGNPGYGKGSLEFVTSVPTEYFTYDSVAKTLVYDYDGNNAYYMGTYSTFTTFSVSNTSYITGDKANTVDVSQYPARFYTVETEPETTEPSETTEPTTAPTEPSTAPTEPEVTEPAETTYGVVAEPQAGVAYKMGMNKNDGNILFFNGQTESATVTYRLATTTNTAEAIDVYLEAVEGVEGGYRLYFMNGETKTYIRVFHRTDGDPGYGKGSLEFVTSVPTEYFIYDSVAKTLVYDYDGNNAYYMGTYSTFTTFSVSNTSYITGNKADTVDVSQYPARLYAAGVVEEPEDTKPTEPEATEPTQPAPTDPSTPATGYVKITDISQLTSGQYVMVAGNGYAPTVLDGTWVLSGTPTVGNGFVTEENAASYIWTITVDGSSVKLTDANGVTVAPKGGNNNGIKSADYSWDVLFADGTFQFAGVGSDTVMLACNSGSQGGNKFRGYKTSTLTGSYAHEYFSYFTLYKIG